jgi:DNA-binding NtrC family response regulator
MASPARSGSARLLVVEDDAAVRRTLSETLTEEGFAVDVAVSAEQALGMVDAAQPDIVLTDVRMPGMDGLELLSLLRQRLSSVDVILMTAYEDMPTIARAMREGAFDFLVKPLRLGELRAVLARAVEDRRERSRTVATEVGEGYALEKLVGRHAGMIEVYKRVAAACCGLLRPAAACCGLLRPAAACCGLLRPAAACCGLLRPAIKW